MSRLCRLHSVQISTAALLMLCAGKASAYDDHSGPAAADARVGLLDVQQLDAANEFNSVRLTVPNGSLLFSYPDQNRGDFHVGFGTGDDLSGGVMIPAVRNTARTNADGFNSGGNNGGDLYAIATVARPASNTQFFVATHGVPSGNEMNIDVAAVHFSFGDGFVAGHALNDTNNGPMTRLIASPGLELGGAFVDPPSSNGVYTLDLRAWGADGSNGVLIVAGGANEANFALSRSNGDGTYSMYCHDKGVNGQAGENDPVAFVYLPYETEGLVAGRIAENSGAEPGVLSGTGGFEVSALGAGRVVVRIDGVSDGTAGALLISPEGGEVGNADNIIVAAWSEELEGYIVESRDIPLMNTQTLGGEPMFSFAYIPVTPGPGIEWRENADVFAVLPDTQYYAQDFPPIFSTQAQWIADMASELNISMVLHVGDVTNRNTDAHWTIARAAIEAFFPAIPMVMAQGNHDCGPNGYATSREDFKMGEYFPVEELAQQPTFGGMFEDESNTYSLIEAGGRKWVVIALEWGPRSQAVEWAHGVLAEHSDRLAIIVTHAYMHRGDQRIDRLVGEFNGTPYGYGTADLPGGTSDGGDLWRELVSQHPNTVMVLCGHITGESRISEPTEYGNVVHQMLTDYQGMPEGGQGFLRLIEMVPGSSTLRLRTYSPWQERYFTGPGSHFEIELVTAPGHDGRIYTGDYTLDGLVDLADLNLVLASFGEEFDLADLNAVLADFGQGG